MITCRHTHILSSISKCSIESVVYPSLKTAQEKIHETHCLLQRSARLRSDLMWIHLSPSWPDLTWMSHSLVFGLKGLLFFSLQFLFQCALVIAFTSRRLDQGVCSSVYMLRCVLTHMTEAVGIFLYFLIFFIVFEMLSWSSRSRSWIFSQMDTSDLLKIRPLAVYPTLQEKPVIVLARFSQLCNVMHA